MEDFVKSFDARVEGALVESAGLLGVHEIRAVGAAVSGGADSVAMLSSLSRAAVRMGFRLVVVTVNHNIRKKEETEGDAAFVENFCRALAGEGFPVACQTRVLREGLVAETAAERKKGCEEAARFLRYIEFARFAEESGAQFICVAHTLDDQLETLLMRFLQGSGSEGAHGIRLTRGMFARPMLKISRAEIVRYLSERGLGWREDSSNSDEKFARNKIRRKIIPLLDAEAAGWRRAALSGAEKARDDNEALDAIAARCPWRERRGALVMERPRFDRESRAVQRRLLFRAIDSIAPGCRAPWAFVSRAIQKINMGANVDERRSGVAVKASRVEVSVKRLEKSARCAAFSVIIESPGACETPIGIVEARENPGGGFSLSLRGSQAAALEVPRLPVCLRSRQSGDKIQSASGGEKSVNDILSDWKVKKEDKDLIPIAQDATTMETRGVWGAALGYKNWTVKN